MVLLYVASIFPYRLQFCGGIWHLLESQLRFWDVCVNYKSKMRVGRGNSFARPYLSVVYMIKIVRPPGLLKEYTLRLFIHNTDSVYMEIENERSGDRNIHLGLQFILLY